LAAFLEESMREGRAIGLKMESGEVIEGVPVWYSREAAALRGADAGEDSDDLCVVQRAWVADWKAGGAPEWEVAATATE
jgi:hypothetical protein